MSRWGVADAVALELIGFAGKIGKSGKRPRFRFGPRHKRVTVFLAEIDTALQASGTSPAWLHTKDRSGTSPIERMAADGVDGMEQTLRILHGLIWRSAIIADER
jgi:hypothetical protein